MKTEEIDTEKSIEKVNTIDLDGTEKVQHEIVIPVPETSEKIADGYQEINSERQETVEETVVNDTVVKQEKIGEAIEVESAQPEFEAKSMSAADSTLADNTNEVNDKPCNAVVYATAVLENSTNSQVTNADTR